MWTDTLFFGAILSLFAYMIGFSIKKKWKLAILNPLLIAVVLVIIVLLVLDVDYAEYQEGAKYISYFLTPATVCLAVTLYEQIKLLKENFVAILVGIVSGVLANMFGIFALCLVFRLEKIYYITLIPKSITTAIGMGVAEELGGITAITVAAIVITGIIGNMIAEMVLKTFRIEEPVAKGIALGTASHAIGTTKAMELGAVEGAASSLAIAVAGLLTAVTASFFVF